LIYYNPIHEKTESQKCALRVRWLKGEGFGFTTRDAFASLF
jgi:hypothetical protein